MRVWGIIFFFIGGLLFMYTIISILSNLLSVTIYHWIGMIMGLILTFVGVFLMGKKEG